MIEKEEYLVNLDVAIIKNVIAAAGLSHEFVSENALFRDKNFLDDCLAKQTMPKTNYMLLCEFFKIGYPTFSSDDKYVFAKEDSRVNNVAHALKSSATIDSPMQNVKVSTAKKTRSKVSDGSIVEFDKEELQKLLKTVKFNRFEFCTSHNRSAGYINTCMQTCRMDKTIYEDLMNELKNAPTANATTKPTRPRKAENADASYIAEVKALIKMTGYSRAEIAKMCGMSPTYINYCFSTNHKLNEAVYNKIVELANNQKSETPVVEPTVTEQAEKVFTTIEKVKSDEIFQEVVPEKIDLVKVTINNKSYVLVDEEKFNKLLDSLALSNEVLEYVSRVTK